MIHGVCCQSREIPQCILQDKVTREEDLLQSKGTERLQSAVIENDSKCKGLIAFLFYDSKPVYFVTKVYEIIQWIKKKLKTLP